MEKILPVLVIVLALAMVVPQFGASASTISSKVVYSSNVILPDDIKNNDCILVPTNSVTTNMLKTIGAQVVQNYDSFTMAKVNTQQKDFLWVNNVVIKAVQDRTKIELNYTTIDTTVGEPTTIPLRITSYPAGVTGTYIVQCIGPIKPEWQSMIQQAGAKIYNYLPTDAYVVKMNEYTRNIITNLGFIQWVGIYQPIYKVPTDILNSNGLNDINIKTFNPQNTGSVATEILKLGGGIISVSDSYGLIHALVDSSILSKIVTIENVNYIERNVEMKVDNQYVVWVVQSGKSGVETLWNHGIHGEGQIAASSDTGIIRTHAAFTARNTAGTLHYHNGPGADGTDSSTATNDHGTHTAGTQAADDTGNANGKGVAYAADYSFYDLSSGATDASTGEQLLDCFPGTYAELYNTLYADGARVCSNSWGGTNLGVYETGCQEVDQYLWDHPDFMLFYSAGNGRGSTSTDQIVGPPASSKDCVAIAACNAGGPTNDTNNIASYSSYGPSHDGRLKPDLTTPGGDTEAVTSSVNGGYAGMEGTSMASPSATGCADLLRQYLAEGWYPTGVKGTGVAMTDPSGSLVKAMLLNGCLMMTGTLATGHPYVENGNSVTYPNDDQGWGRLTLANSVYFSGDATRLFLADDKYGLVTGESKEYDIPMTSTAGDIRTMLVWTDYPGDPAASKILVNDLDLTVTNPAGTSVYKGNYFSTSTHKSQTGGSYDSMNPVESVWTTSSAGIWKFTITATNIAQGPQPYALVVRAPIDATSGKIYLDKPTYNDADTVGVTVESTAASVTVTVNSTSDPTGVSVPLTGGATSSVWTGSVPTATTSSASQIGVKDKDTITASFTDAGGTHIATALVNLQGPIISGVWVNGIADSFATVNWGTTQSSNSTVIYGTSTTLSSVKITPMLCLAHAVTLTNLVANTLYYFEVASATRLGKSAMDNNGGLLYTFSTGKQGSILFVDSGNSTDILVKPRYNDMFSSRGWTYSTWDTQQKGAPTWADMENYYAVVWETSEKYPQLLTPEMTAITTYITNGGRFFISSHDVGWDIGGPSGSGGHETAASRSWFWNTLLSYWVGEDSNTTAGSSVTWYGKSGDPVTGSGTWPSTGIKYYVARAGGIEDYIKAGASYTDGTPTFGIWKDSTSSTANNVAMRWESTSTHGTAGNGIWGGQTSRIVYDAFKLYQVDGTNSQSSIRDDVMNATLIWLVSTPPPYVTLTTPVGGEVINTPTYNIQWFVSTADTIGLQYSDNGGQAWHDIAGATALTGTTTSFTWNVAGLTSKNTYRVKVIASKSVGTSSMMGMATSHGNFTISPSGPVGWIAGTVTDSGTSLPISGVTVTAGTASGFTDASGKYNLTLSSPATSLSVTFTKSGYVTTTKTGINVATGVTTTLDVALTPNPVPAITHFAPVVLAVGGVMVLLLVDVRRRRKFEDN